MGRRRLVADVLDGHDGKLAAEQARHVDQLAAIEHGDAVATFVHAGGAYRYPLSLFQHHCPRQEDPYQNLLPIDRSC